MDNGHTRPSAALLAFMLFSAFAVCANLATAIHEFGHALGCWLGGGQVTGFVLRPFDFSYVSTHMENLPPWSHMLKSGGGILFGILFAVPLFPLSRQFARGSVGWLIAWMTFTLAFGLNGVLLLQSVVTGHGDPEAVLVYGHLGYGIPPVVIKVIFALVAIPVLAVFGRCMFHLLRTYGPVPGDSQARWVITVAAGFFPYFILMTAHTAVFGDRELLFRQLLSFYVPFMLLFLSLIVAAAMWVYRSAGPTRELPPSTIQLSVANAVILFLIACAVIGIELVSLGPR